MRHWHYNNRVVERKRYVVGIDDIALALGSTTLGAGAGIGLNWLFGGDEDQFNYQFQQDPYYTQSQQFAFPYYSEMLKGNIPDYYKPLGEYGGKEFEDILGLTTRDITRSVTEDMARRNITGGMGTDVIAQKTADTSKQLRWSDFLRAMEGRGNLLNIGTRGLEGVRSAGLSNQGQMNQIGYDVASKNYDTGLAEDAMWSSILGSTIGTVGNVYGMNQMKDIFGKGTESGTVIPTLGSANIGTGSKFQLGDLTEADLLKILGR